MKHFERYEIWSVKVWTLSGLVFGAALAAVGLLAGGPSFTAFFAPLAFSLSASLAVTSHNRQVTRWRDMKRPLNDDQG